MDKSIHSKAAGILRKVLGQPESVPTPGEELKPTEPVTPPAAAPVEPTK